MVHALQRWCPKVGQLGHIFQIVLEPWKLEGKHHQVSLAIKKKNATCT
jgi:hypothetical protein